MLWVFYLVVKIIVSPDCPIDVLSQNQRIKRWAMNRDSKSVQWKNLSGKLEQNLSWVQALIKRINEDP